MGKKREHKVVLSCDPSFKGCAFLLWDKADNNYSKAQVYDIRDGRKQYDSFLIQVQLVNDLLREVFLDFDPRILDCTVFIIEGQFKPKMQCLLHAIVNQLYVMMPEENNLKVFTISARTWRPYFVDLGTGNYLQRKKASVEYVRANPQLICSERWSKDDNVCEAILLLNYVVRKHSLLVRDTMPIRLWLGDEHRDFTDTQIKKACPDCKESKWMSIRLVGKGDKKGEPYFHCKNCQSKTNNGYKGAVTNKKWLDLIRSAQREAGNYLLDEEEQPEEEYEPLPLPAPTKRRWPTPAPKPKKQSVDYEFEIKSLKARVFTLEQMLLQMMNSQEAEEDEPSVFSQLPAKRKKMEKPTTPSFTHFSDEERYENGDPDNMIDYAG